MLVARIRVALGEVVRIGANAVCVLVTRLMKDGGFNIICMLVTQVENHNVIMWSGHVIDSTG